MHCTNVLLYAREKWGSYFSLVTCEDCLEVCFVGLVVEWICVWRLVILAIFVRFGQARAKKYGGMLKSHQLGVAMQVIKGGLFSKREGRFSLCNTAVL